MADAAPFVLASDSVSSQGPDAAQGSGTTQDLDEDLASNINYFRSYRGVPRWAEDEIKDNYQREDYQQPAVFQPQPPQPNAWPAPPPLKAIAPLSPIQKDFLASTIPDLEDAAQAKLGGGPGNWKATKYLGSGSFGMVALWEYEGPVNAQGQRHHRVVVKESTHDEPSQGCMSDDYRIMKQLEQSGSPHINHVLANARWIDAQPGDVDEAWDGYVKRLILEYCPLGDLKQLIIRFQRL
jgi:hypothetical protein